MGLYDLCVAALLFLNSVAILNEERFLAKCERFHPALPGALRGRGAPGGAYDALPLMWFLRRWVELPRAGGGAGVAVDEGANLRPHKCHLVHEKCAPTPLARLLTRRHLNLMPPRAQCRSPL